VIASSDKRIAIEKILVLRRRITKFQYGKSHPMDDESALKKEVSGAGRWVRIGAMSIVGGLIFEVILLLWFSAEKTKWETGLLIVATLIIAAGVWIEDHFAHKAGDAAEKLQRISDEKIAEANARAAEAQLETERLRGEHIGLQQRLAPRTLSKAQADVLQSLKGRVSSINLAGEQDRETWDLIAQISSALVAAGIAVGTYNRDTSLRGQGNMVCVVSDPSQDDPLSDLLVSTFNAAGIPIKDRRPWLPSDLKSAPADVPMVCIGIKPWPDAEVGATPEK
jgi:hypothetical protein